MSIAIRMQDFARSIPVYLANILKQQCPGRKSIMVAMFSSPEAAACSYGVE